eukprot:TRINITY_DN1111_c0_g1_i1.p2 TRINITY_DN1111_c0_g1~~TRINITY_DN1111_c0_g1_i1.p2  ORF type:complete len:450 (+),score=43.76 TRINITY_DN1111_c0_g1_i1:2551-3900(+)
MGVQFYTKFKLLLAFGTYVTNYYIAQIFIQLNKETQQMGAANEGSALGYRIVSVDPGSPISQFPIEPMLDFIVYPEQGSPTETASFEEFLVKNENNPTTLTLYNIASRKMRKISIVPRKWDGKGLLGATIRLEDYSMAHKRVLRVLNIYVGSPLHKAGFKVKKDYIVGDDKTGFKSIDDFSEFIAQHDKQELEFSVYNSDEGKVRKVTLRPDKDWGGSGFLGGDIGFGELHVLPIRETLLEETEPAKAGEGELPVKGRRKSTEEEEKENVGVMEAEILIGQKGDVIKEKEVKEEVPAKHEALEEKKIEEVPSGPPKAIEDQKPEAAGALPQSQQWIYYSIPFVCNHTLIMHSMAKNYINKYFCGYNQYNYKINEEKTSHTKSHHRGFEKRPTIFNSTSDTSSETRACFKDKANRTQEIFNECPDTRFGSTSKASIPSKKIIDFNRTRRD